MIKNQVAKTKIELFLEKYIHHLGLFIKWQKSIVLCDW